MFNSSILIDERQDIILLYAWITKAIVLNPSHNSLDGMSMMSDILSLHNDSDICKTVPKAIDIIICDDSNGYLSKDSFCKISVCFIRFIFRFSISRKYLIVASQY